VVGGAAAAGELLGPVAQWPIFRGILG
jgi:hypothetical protein